MEKKDYWLQCNVCGTQYKNWVGSTPCCGSLAYLVDDKGIKTNSTILFTSVNGGNIKPTEIKFNPK